MSKICSFLCTRVGLFVVIFALCIFFGSMGTTYMVTAVQSLQRQYHISSKTSGVLISAHEIGYVPSVVILSYLGSKGNRARWIGFGSLLIAVGNLFISSPNFVFPATGPELNETLIETLLKTPEYLRDTDSSNAELLNHPFFQAIIPPEALQYLKENSDHPEKYWDFEVPEKVKEDIKERAKENPEKFQLILDVIVLRQKPIGAIFDQFRKGILTEEGLQNRKDLIGNASLPVSYCRQSVNRLRQMMEGDKCAYGSTNNGAVGMIAFALVMVGVGHSMPWSLGVPLVDDNVKKTSMPVYFGLIFGIKFLGPLLGFFLGAFCNNFYNNLKQPIGLTPADPRWISAWWLGFVMIGVCLFGPAIAMFCFPANPPSKSESCVELETEQDKEPQLVLVDRHRSTEEKGSFGHEAKQFGLVVLNVVRSPVAMGTIIGRTIDAFAFKGFLAFMPKYLEDHYGLDPSQSNTVMGFAGLIMMISGLAIGSVLMKKLKLEGRRAAAWVAAASLLAVLLSMSQIFLGCHSVVSAVGQTGSKSNYTFTASCNTDCMCADAKLHPVCSRDGESFYSPCHAGCEVMRLVDRDTGQLNFTNCACVNGGQVSRDWCGDDCGLMVVLYMGFTMCAGFVGALTITPSMMLFLRSVDPEHRSVALGLNAFTVSVGTLASPILFGAVIDSACLLWENACGSDGNCTIYDPQKLRVRINSLVMVGKILALSMDLWVWYFAKGLRLVTEEEEENDKKGSRQQENVDMGQIST